MVQVAAPEALAADAVSGATHELQSLLHIHFPGQVVTREQGSRKTGISLATISCSTMESGYLVVSTGRSLCFCTSQRREYPGRLKLYDLFEAKLHGSGCWRRCDRA